MEKSFDSHLNLSAFVPSQRAVGILEVSDRSAVGNSASSRQTGEPSCCLLHKAVLISPAGALQDSLPHLDPCHSVDSESFPEHLLVLVPPVYLAVAIYRPVRVL